MWRLKKKTANCKPERGLSSEPNQAGMLISKFTVSRAVRNKFMFYKPPSLLYFYFFPNWPDKGFPLCCKNISLGVQTLNCAPQSLRTEWAQSVLCNLMWQTPLSHSLTTRILRFDIAGIWHLTSLQTPRWGHRWQTQNFWHGWEKSSFPIPSQWKDICFLNGEWF